MENMTAWVIAFICVFVAAALVGYIVEKKTIAKMNKQNKRYQRNQNKKTFLRRMWELGY